MEVGTVIRGIIVVTTVIISMVTFIIFWNRPIVAELFYKELCPKSEKRYQT